MALGGKLREDTRHTCFIKFTGVEKEGETGKGGGKKTRGRD